ncbi:MAG: hypothetical protein ABSA66_20270 [Roseiarcus sp.]|jgi:HPt (histidine-containing phosphotransfer) domain-containing protein
MSTLDLFLSLAKVDLDQRIVQGVATAEVPDRVGEICDYASTKPYFETWSADALAASGGKSFGAVRAMHGRVAAGKLTDIAFDDEGKRILVAAKIVDDDEWRKVTEGVYTGFSQGGRYVKRWPDPDSGLTRYTAEPSEISLVDLPCLPGATFEVVKDGIVEKRAFAAARQEAQETPAVPAAEAAPVIAADPPRASAPSPSDALAKAAQALSQAAQKLERAIEENSALRKSLADLSPAIADLAKRLAALEARPLPARAALRAVPKSADSLSEPGGGVDEAIKRLAALPAQERALALTKLSLANPIPPRF